MIPPKRRPNKHNRPIKKNHVAPFAIKIAVAKLYEAPAKAKLPSKNKKALHDYLLTPLVFSPYLYPI
jgi:hypothetical protein